jgi:hypothetical protein
VKQLRSSIAWEGEYFVMDAVENLKKLVKAGYKLDAQEFAELSELIAKMPTKYSAEVKPTLELFRSARE